MKQRRNKIPSYPGLGILLLILLVLAGIAGLTFTVMHLKQRPLAQPAVTATKTVHFEFENPVITPLKETKKDTTYIVTLPQILEPYPTSNTEVQIEENENLSTEFSKTYSVPLIEKIVMKPQTEEKISNDKIYYNADEMPLFNGGKYDTFRGWIEKNLRYPEIAAENGISGRVVIRFSVNYKGEVCDVKVVKGVDPTLDKEAIRVISSSPKWTPGKIKGRPVKIQFNFPVYFDLK